MNPNAKVTMIRTIGGEFLIGFEDKIEITDANGNTTSNEDSYTLTDARVFNLQMTAQGQAAIAFVPLFPFCTSKNIDTITISKSHVLVKVDECDIDGEITNGYKSHITGIDLSAVNKFVM